MPLVSMPDGADEKVRTKIEKTRANMLEKATSKFLFKVRPLRAPHSLIIEHDRVAGMRFARTRMDGGKLVQTDELEEVRGSQVISSIGSIPEPIEGVPMKGELYGYSDWISGACRTSPPLRGGQRGDRRATSSTRRTRSSFAARARPLPVGRRRRPRVSHRLAARALARVKRARRRRLRRLPSGKPAAELAEFVGWQTAGANPAPTCASTRTTRSTGTRGDEARRARAEDKPVLVSIGYSSCHWCHVMERESFEDPNVGRLMNELVIAIKVDREERPDVDQIYMEAVQRMTGSGGWPLNMFCMPDGRPFMGGTYFPPRRMHNRPSFAEVVLAVSRASPPPRDDVTHSAD
jgi:hypothetical protein